jgi:hypothetical protein
MRAALVVGINDYSGTARLRGPVNDANEIASALETHDNGNPNFYVKPLTTPGITKPMLRGAIETLFAADCDVCLFYFSGHGIIKSTGGYIVTTDARKYDEGIPMNEIVDLANDSQVRDKVILLDCCHSGAVAAEAIKGNNAALLSEGLSILTASRGSESALEINGKSVFTALVVDALRGGAADICGNITAGSIYAYVDQALGPFSQRPIFKTNVTRFTSLRSSTPRVPYETLRKICIYFPNAQDEHRLDPSYEFTDSSANPARVEIMKDLQKFASVGLVVPVDAEFMYFAAMKSKACRLTALGYQYWRLVNENLLRI